MPSKPLTYRVAFSTPWFDLEESVVEDPGESPYYRLTGPDAVICFPFTPDGDIVMVRQYRPSIDQTTLETPAGAIDGGETAIDAAAREIVEELGYRCGELVELGHGRLYLNRTNHVEHFVVGFDARPSGTRPEEGIETVIVPRPELRRLVRADRIEQVATLSFLGMASAKLGVDLLQDPMALIRGRVAEERDRRERDGRQQD